MDVDNETIQASTIYLYLDMTSEYIKILLTDYFPHDNMSARVFACKCAIKNVKTWHIIHYNNVSFYVSYLLSSNMKTMLIQYHFHQKMVGKCYNYNSIFLGFPNVSKVLDYINPIIPCI